MDFNSSSACRSLSAEAFGPECGFEELMDGGRGTVKRPTSGMPISIALARQLIDHAPYKSPASTARCSVMRASSNSRLVSSTACFVGSSTASVAASVRTNETICCA